MTAKNQDFTMYAGDTKNLVVTVTNTDNSAVDLTGASVTWHMRKSSTSTKLTKGTASGGVTITTPTSGIFTVSLVPADTAHLIGNFYHDAEITDAQGNVSTVLTGKITVTSG